MPETALQAIQERILDSKTDQISFLKGEVEYKKELSLWYRQQLDTALSLKKPLIVQVIEALKK